MPLYEYLCDDCGERFEVIQKFADEPLISHEKCGGKAHRLLSVPSLQFKGSGFYITDYAKGSGSGSPNNSGNKDKGETKEKKSESSSSGSSEGSSTSAPATNSAPSETKAGS